MANPKVGRLIASVIVLIGAVLLIAALVTPWYSFKTPVPEVPGATVTSNSYPDLPSTSGGIQYSCSGLPAAAACPSSTSYNDARLNNTGNIAETGFFLLIVGLVVGIVAFIFGIMSRGNVRRVTPAIALAVVAMIFAIITPVLFAAALPNAISKDSPGATGSGPWSSFIGSSSGASWGPAVGWYLSIGAFVVLLIGLILLFLWRRQPAEPAPVTAPAPSAPSPTPPTTP
jgi:hypothetical protein